MIKINGVQIPTPSDYQVMIADLSIAERVASGYLQIERIATKRKIELIWFYLTNEQLSNLLTLVAPVSFQVEYTDPQTNELRTGEFYCGDRNVRGFKYHNGRIWYRDIKFNLIER